MFDFILNFMDLKKCNYCNTFRCKSDFSFSDENECENCETYRIKGFIPKYGHIFESKSDCEDRIAYNDFMSEHVRKKRLKEEMANFRKRFVHGTIYDNPVKRALHEQFPGKKIDDLGLEELIYFGFHSSLILHADLDAGVLNKKL